VGGEIFRYMFKTDLGLNRASCTRGSRSFP
jgi:hypothetical protein